MGKANVGKRPATPFFMFRASVYQKVKTEHPERKQTELAKIIGEMWHKLDADTRNGFEEEYAKKLEIFKNGVSESESSGKGEESPQQTEEVSKKRNVRSAVAVPSKSQLMKKKAAAKKSKAKPTRGSGRKRRVVAH